MAAQTIDCGTRRNAFIENILAKVAHLCHGLGLPRSSLKMLFQMKLQVNLQMDLQWSLRRLLQMKLG